MKAIVILSTLLLSTVIMKISNIDISRSPPVVAANQLNENTAAFFKGSNLSEEQQAIVSEYIAEHPSEAPYWFGLLSTLATALVGAIIRLLEKRLMRRRQGSLFKRIFSKSDSEDDISDGGPLR